MSDVGWLTARNPDAHVCELPTALPLFAKVRAGDFWRCTCGTLYVLEDARPRLLKWLPSVSNPGTLRPIDMAPPPPLTIATEPKQRRRWWRGETR